MEILNNKNILPEGIYTHIYNAKSKEDYLEQLNKFKTALDNINNLEEIKILHISASEALAKYEKPDFINGCRLGIIMYGFTESKELDLKSTFSVYSEIIQINKLKKGDKVRI